MTTHNEGEIASRNFQVEAISKRVDSQNDPLFAETKDEVIADRKFLLEFVRRQAAQLKAVRQLADTSVHRISAEDLITALEQTADDAE
jgi:hypothetical protein